MEPAVVHGYYRFSDIWFEWHQVLPDPDDFGPLKAMISYESLVDPGHPLRKDGVDGIELYTGTLINHETRLLFSSAQIEYVRYWLHAMGLTKEPIPIPNSDALVLASQLRNVSPVVYNDAGELKKAMKTVEKNNKRLKNIDATLMARRHLFERVRALWAERAGVWCAVDFEDWERDHMVITEFGWTLTRWIDNRETVEEGHLCVKENMTYRNHSWVPDHRDNYMYGQSEVIPKAEFKTRINNLITENSKNGPLFLVFHDASQDIKTLRSKQIGAPIENINFSLPDEFPKQGIYAIDTAELFAALEGSSTNNRRGLDRACLLLGMHTEFLHNAGNDAHYTFELLRSLASGDPVDIQREKRWPSRTDNGTSGVKVDFKPWEEDPEYSDEEGIMPLHKLPGYDMAATLFPNGIEVPASEEQVEA